MASVLVPDPIVREFELYAMILPEPWPIRVMVLPDMFTPAVHAQVPAGIVTVSPGAAELIAVCTAVAEQEVAAMVLASDGKTESAAKRSPRIALFVSVDIGCLPSEPQNVA